MDTNSIKRSSDSGNLLLILKNGETQKIIDIDGGGMMIGGSDDDGPFGGSSGYEIFVVVDQEGTQECFPQDEIAAIVDLSDNRQVEFGNSFLSPEISNHPRVGATLNL
jgi:hypothetical protein